MGYILKIASLAILKLVLILASLATKFLFPRLIRSEPCYEICLRDSREASLATNFNSRVSRESRENFASKKRVSLLPRISKSDSRVNPTCRHDGQLLDFCSDR